MTIYITTAVERKIQKLINKDPLLAQKIDQRLAQFQENPRHPSLRIHKLTGKTRGAWSLSVNAGYRLLFDYTESGILVVDIGSHEEVY